MKQLSKSFSNKLFYFSYQKPSFRISVLITHTWGGSFTSQEDTLNFSLTIRSGVQEPPLSLFSSKRMHGAW